MESVAFNEMFQHVCRKAIRSWFTRNSTIMNW